MSDTGSQEKLEADVTSLETFVTDVLAEINALKAQVAAGQPLDFTSLDALVAQATAADPGAPAV